MFPSSFGTNNIIYNKNNPIGTNIEDTRQATINLFDGPMLLLRLYNEHMIRDGAKPIALCADLHSFLRSSNVDAHTLYYCTSLCTKYYTEFLILFMQYYECLILQTPF